MTRRYQEPGPSWQDLTYMEPRPVHTVQSVYANDMVLPDKYIVIDFRPPNHGETFLSMNGKDVVIASRLQANGLPIQYGDPRLILERQKIRKVVFTEVRQGRLERGEWYRYPGEGSAFGRHMGDGITNHQLIAYTREDIEE